MKIINLYELAERSEILAGKPRGKSILAKLIQEVNSQDFPEPLFLDLRQVELATSSFFREAILGFRDYCIGQQTNLIPVVANANSQTLDEFLVVLENKGDALVVCDLKDSRIINARIVGILEEKQAMTLEAVLQAKETDAIRLEEKFRTTENIKTTSWNNRLVSLASKGILIERRRGRLKLYRPILEVSYGY